MISEIAFKFDFKAVSFQQARFANGGMYKTTYQKEFETDVKRVLIKGRDRIREFEAHFKPLEHVLESTWFFGYENFFTVKEGIPSSKCLDLDNSTKNVQDIIFKSMGLDDKFICKTQSVKWKSKDDCIFLVLKILKKEEMNEKVEKYLSEHLPI